jgi:Icc protein
VVLRILHLSDTHLRKSPDSMRGKKAEQRLASVLERFSRRNETVDIIVVTGDIAGDRSAQACERLSHALHSFGIPVLAVPGNHDDPTEVRTCFPESTVERGNWRFVGVDTSRPDRTRGAVDSERLFDSLAQLDGRPTVLAMHHPPVSPATGLAFRLDGAEKFLREMALRPHIKVILSGHIHHPFVRHAADRLVIYGAPATSTGFKHWKGGLFTRTDRATGGQVVLLPDDGEGPSQVTRF